MHCAEDLNDLSLSCTFHAHERFSEAVYNDGQFQGPGVRTQARHAFATDTEVAFIDCYPRCSIFSDAPSNAAT